MKNSNSSNFTNISTNSDSSNNAVNKKRVTMRMNTEKMKNIQEFLKDLKKLLSEREFKRIQKAASKKTTYNRYQYLSNEIYSFLSKNAVSMRIVAKNWQSNKSRTTGNRLPTYINVSITNSSYMKYINKYFELLLDKFRGNNKNTLIFNRSYGKPTEDPVIARITIKDYGENTIPNNIKRGIQKLKNDWGTIKNTQNSRNNNRNEKYFKPTEIVYTHNKKQVPKVKVSKNTELLNSSFTPVKRISKIKPERRVFIKNEIGNNGTLIRLYDKKGIHRYLMKKAIANKNEGRELLRTKNISGRLYGNKFQLKNIIPLKRGNNVINANVINMNTFLNSVENDVKKRLKNKQNININLYKNKKPPGITNNDISNFIQNLKNENLSQNFKNKNIRV
jgi:hypothetical protein